MLNVTVVEARDRAFQVHVSMELDPKALDAACAKQAVRVVLVLLLLAGDTAMRRVPMAHHTQPTQCEPIIKFIKMLSTRRTLTDLPVSRVHELLPWNWKAFVLAI